MTVPPSPENPTPAEGSSTPPAPSGYEVPSSSYAAPSPAPGYGAPGYSAPTYGTPGYAPAPAGRPTNSMAIVALVAGIAGWTFLPLLGSIAAVIIGPMAVSQIKQTGEEGTTLAKVGLWLGWAAIILTALAVLAFVMFALFIGANVAAVN